MELTGANIGSNRQKRMIFQKKQIEKLYKTNALQFPRNDKIEIDAVSIVTNFS